MKRDLAKGNEEIIKHGVKKVNIIKKGENEIVGKKSGRGKGLQT